MEFNDGLLLLEEAIALLPVPPPPPGMRGAHEQREGTEEEGHRDQAELGCARCRVHRSERASHGREEGLGECVMVGIQGDKAHTHIY